MIKISETNYDYVFENEQLTMKISKNIWKQLPKSTLGDVLKDGNDTVIFSKTPNGIKIQKTFKDKFLVFNTDEYTWEYIKQWVKYPEKRDELAAEYKNYMKPEEVEKRKIEKFAEQFDPNNPENQKKKEEAYSKIEVVEEGTVGVSGDTGNKPEEKILTREMVDTLTFDELKEKIVKEKYKAPNYAKSQQSIFSEAWRKSHWQLKNMGGKIGLFWDSVSPYAYDYQIVWDIMINMIFEEKNTHYTHKTYQNVKDQVKCWEEKAQKQNKPNQKVEIDVLNDVELPFD